MSNALNARRAARAGATACSSAAAQSNGGCASPTSAANLAASAAHAAFRIKSVLADSGVTSASPRSANAAARERWYARVAALDASLHAAAAAAAAATDVSADRIAPRRRLAAALFS